MTRKISFPVSAQEWAASASIEADRVTTAAIDFGTATRRWAAKATRTVVRLAEPAPRAARDSGPRNGSELTPAPPSEGGIMLQASLIQPGRGTCRGRFGRLRSSVGAHGQDRRDTGLRKQASPE